MTAQLFSFVDFRAARPVISAVQDKEQDEADMLANVLPS
jgi:hypothetical protein